MELCVPEAPADKAEALDLGVILGRTRALGLIAGRRTAAQAAGIRRLRNEKLYLGARPRWEEFCPSVCTSAAPRPTIRRLDENGPIYFEMSQLVWISPATFRAIAPYIKDGALHLNGQTIELSMENAKQVAAAVPEFRYTLPAPREKTPQQRVEVLDECARQLVAEFADLSETDRQSGDWTSYRVALTRTTSVLRRLELQTDLQ